MMKRSFAGLFIFVLTVYGFSVGVVENPMDPTHSTGIKVKKILEFSPDNPAKDIFLTLPLPAVEGLNGQIYVVDGQSGLVYQYDSTGHYLRTFCGKGQGPDKVNFPGEFLVNFSGQILVFDPFSTQLLLFSPKGIFRKSIRLESELGYASGLLQVTGGWVISVSKHDKEGQHKRDVIVFLDKAFNEVREICPLSEWKKVEGIPITFDNAFSIFTAGESRIYVSKGSRTDIVIRVLNLRGQEINTIMRDYRSVRRSDDEIKRLDDMARHQKAMYPKLAFVPASPYQPSVTDMFVDGKGRLWVKTAREAGKNGSKWDYSIFDKTGTLIGRIPALKGKVTVHENRLCQLYADKKTDEFRVAVYKIVEEKGE